MLKFGSWLYMKTFLILYKKTNKQKKKHILMEIKIYYISIELIQTY